MFKLRQRTVAVTIAEPFGTGQSVRSVRLGLSLAFVSGKCVCGGQGLALSVLGLGSCCDCIDGSRSYVFVGFVLQSCELRVCRNRPRCFLSP
jgi:hypothetical protein